MKSQLAFSPSEDSLIDIQLIRKGSLILRIIKHPLRLQMLQLIHRKQSMTVTEIFEQMGLEQSVASQHLALLRKIKVAQAKREGKKVNYSINYARLNDLKCKIDALLQS